VSDRDDLPIFKPRIGKRTRANERVRSGSFRNAVLARIGRGGVRRGETAPVHPLPRPDARRVVVKAHVAKLRAGGAKAAALHLRYIERDGVERDGSKGKLYDGSGAVSRARFEEPRPNEAHMFRFIVSPEDADRLDMTAYVRRLMSQVERDLGRKIE